MNARTDELPLEHTELVGRQIPWSQEAEQSVLGGLLLDNDAFDRVGDLLLEQHFFAISHRRIYAAIASMVNANKPADVITVHERLKALGEADDCGGLVYLNALSASVPSASNCRRYAEIVREKALQRSLMAAADHAMTIALEKGDATDRTDRCIGLFDALQQLHVQQRPRAADEIAVRRMDHFSDIAEGRVEAAWGTGLEDVDTALNGGLQEGRVYVLAARPSIGKSSLALQIGLHTAKELHRGVLLLSQEMPGEECIDRAISNLGRVDYGQMQRGQLDDAAWAGMSFGCETVSKLPLWIDDQPALTVRDIRAKAFSMRRDGLKLLIVDYLQLCAGQSPGKGVNRSSELEEITRGLKAMAKQLHVSVLLLSQLNRDVEKRGTPEPTLADLRDSGAIEQDADAVLGLWFVRQWSDRKVMALSVLKNRQGERGKRIPLEFFGHYQLWQSSTADVSPVVKKAGGGDGSFE